MLKKLTSYYLLVALIINILPQVTIAIPINFVEGEHFKLLRSRRPELEINNPKLHQEHDLVNNLTANQIKQQKPEIILFFNYGCYSCWQMQKEFTAWVAMEQQNLNFIYSPVSFNPMWEDLARLYYLNEVLKVYTDQEIFDGIYKERKKLWQLPELVAWYALKKIPENEVLKVYNSFDVARKVKHANILAEIYGINITPNVVLNINNKSYMVNFTMVKDFAMLTAVIKSLISQNMPVS